MISSKEGYRETNCGSKLRRNKVELRKIGEQQKKNKRERKHIAVVKWPDWNANTDNPKH